MRKLTLILFAMLLCMPAFSKQKIRIERVEPDSTKEEIVTYRTKSNHWSLTGHFGVGFLDGDQKQSYSTIFPHSAKELNFGINLEYSFNPIWGLYLEYLYNPYGGTAPYTNQIADHHFGEQMPFKGMNHEGVLGVSLNLLNLFSSCRPQVFNWYGNVGIGASIFKITEHPMLGTDPLKVLPVWEKGVGRDGRSMSIPIGTTLEVNATRWLAILLNVQYRMHFQDIYDGAVRGNQNDNTAYAGLGLRWKINSLSHPNRDHVRNMAMCTWEQNASEKLAKDNAKRLDTIAGKVDYLKTCFDALEPRVRILENEMEQLRDSDEDGVPDVRDKHPNTPRGTPVNYYGEPISGTGNNIYGGNNGTGGAYIPGGNRGGNATTSAYDPNRPLMEEEGLSVYFATGKYDISAASHTVLAAIARRMQAHPDYQLEIHAYCDEQGVRSNYQNQKLSDNRAKKVRDTLISKYGVDANKIVLVKGYGVLQGPTIDYLPNRRADMIFIR